MGQPTLPTIKKLFALSGNCCAFPHCTTPLIDEISGKVTGKICHIKGQRPNGPRYDPNQSEEKRQSISNLLLLCPIHHDVIDTDTESYTGERLYKMKQDHEKTMKPTKEISDSMASSFIANINKINITNGSVIFSNNQMGGQTAHSIVNVGRQPRRISQAAANALIADLRKRPSEQVKLTGLLGDTESTNLTEIIENILNAAGWTTRISSGAFNSLPKNIVITINKKSEEFDILINWFANIGFKPQGYINEEAKENSIIIGANI